MERLNKFLSDCGVCSRRKADEYIKEGKVYVNGVQITELGHKIKKTDQVTFENKVLVKEEKVYYLLNKPTGYITTSSDELKRRTVLDLFLPEHLENRIFPVGRLDYDTSGALLLTNDGELTNRLIHPSLKVEKEYLARVEGIVTRKELITLRNGVKLSDGYLTKKCDAEIESIDKKNQSTLVKIIISEGKYHQVRLMFEAIGHPVKKLNRTRFYNLTTEGLKKGEYRQLKIHEIKQLKSIK